MDWDILERNLPTYQFSERHRIAIEAPTDLVWQALKTARVEGSPLTRGAVAVRMLPARLAGRAIPRPALFDLSGMNGFLRLGEAPGRELVLGMVGQFWRPRGGLAEVTAEDFVGFSDPEFAKLAWGFRLVDHANHAELHTETRIFCPTPGTVRRFTPYWFAIRPISGLIRREILAGIRSKALAL